MSQSAGRHIYLDDLWVKLHLVACDWVNKWGDQLEERIKQEGDVENQSQPKALRIMVLQNIEHGPGSTE